GMALSGDRAVGRAAWRTGGLSSAFWRRGAGELSADCVRRSPEHLSRAGTALPRRLEHLLFRERQLRERRIANDFRRDCPGRRSHCLAAVRTGGPADRRRRYERGDGIAREPL